MGPAYGPPAYSSSPCSRSPDDELAKPGEALTILLEWSVLNVLEGRPHALVLPSSYATLVILGTQEMVMHICR